MKYTRLMGCVAGLLMGTTVYASAWATGYSQEYLYSNSAQRGASASEVQTMMYVQDARVETHLDYAQLYSQTTAPSYGTQAMNEKGNPDALVNDTPARPVRYTTYGGGTP